ncbi:hypothetical protein TBLA_0A10460 [Henningerozyma blattae CBS 6284]|uniref:Alpha-MPP n=1 Tax=Henningerozyma blattae (strain ATCC 34711 / CBS 6284 / DSM 70876 / NBRC 10599 / NRRL Y-10934 / UCD 77-7) TaxID=1071380 RepID=I2GXH2_HENB6|nr:hypothetical protein TBLA_0A10460 [Tetrapisispora blattae CBS 6284]CCH58824.1 hypothetical protein TBLA_0A10460 [Tetrapisispora blattae CBS 6284]
MLRISSRLYSTALRDTFKKTTLPNGVTVATSNTKGHFSAVGLYMHAGSRFETPETIGCTHLLDRLAFKSTQNYSGKDISQKLELLGGNYQCISSRETMIYQASVFNQDVDKMLKLMSQTVKSPLITVEEVEEQKQIAQYEVGEIWQKPELALPELLHTTAFAGKTLGAPLLCPLESIPTVTPNTLQLYRDALYTPKNTVAAFVGVPHDKAVEMALTQFADWNLNPNSKVNLINTSTPEVAQYIGGEACLPPAPYYGATPIELYHFQIGFESYPAAHDSVYAGAVLQTLLGGGSSFSAGGPGKGMFSRLYTDILNVHYEVDTCNAFSHTYSDTGLFGIHVSCFKNNANDVLNVIANEIATFLEPNSFNDSEVKRAKNQLKSSLLMNLESRLVELEDMGRQLAVQNTRIPVSEMIQKIENVTTKDVQDIAREIFTGKVKNAGSGTGKPTIVMQGEREAFGDVMGTLKKYGLGKHDGRSTVKATKKRWF